MRATPGFYRLVEDVAGGRAPLLALGLLGALLALVAGAVWVVLSPRARDGRTVAVLTAVTLAAELAAVGALVLVAVSTPELTLAFGIPAGWAPVLALPTVGAVTGSALLVGALVGRVRPRQPGAVVLISTGALLLWAVLARLGLALPG